MAFYSVTSGILIRNVGSEAGVHFKTVMCTGKVTLFVVLVIFRSSAKSYNEVLVLNYVHQTQWLLS